MSAEDSPVSIATASPQELLIRPGRPEEDADFVDRHVQDMAATHEGMLEFCSMRAKDHRQVLQSGLASLLVAEAGADGRPAGFALYTRSHSSRHDSPGLYLQAIYVCQGHRGLQVGKSLLIALARLAMSAGSGHLKLIVQSDNSAVDWYRRLGFQILTECRNVGFFEVTDADAVAEFAQCGLRPLPDGVSLELRPCGGQEEVDVGGRRFELTCADCDCRLTGTAALTYCMWQGPVLNMDMSAERPVCSSSAECAAVSSASLSGLIGRLVNFVAPSASRIASKPLSVLWVDAVRGCPQSFGLDGLLERVGFVDTTVNEHWLICLLDGAALQRLASVPLTCRLHPELTD